MISLSDAELDVVCRMQKNAGAVRITRGASFSHCGQSCGSSHSAIGRMPSHSGPKDDVIGFQAMPARRGLFHGNRAKHPSRAA